jgi:cytidine diphosphoramidate kinase
MLLDHRTQQEGFIAWITGLAGAGKSSVACALRQELSASGIETILLDGDLVREVFAGDLGYSPSDRRKNAWRIARLARMLSHQGFHVVVPTVSMFHEVREWLRSEVPGYREIYLRVPLEVLRERDKKGLYSGFENGAVTGVAGLDVGIEEPTCPDLILDNAEARAEFGEFIATIRSVLPI